MADSIKAENSALNGAVQSNSLQESLMDNMPCGAGIYEFKDGRMRLVYQNKVYWELVGLNEEAYPDASEMSATHPEDIPIVIRNLPAPLSSIGICCVIFACATLRVGICLFSYWGVS